MNANRAQIRKTLKTKCAAPSKLKAAQSVFLKENRSSQSGRQHEHVHARVANLYPDDQLAVS